MIKWMLGFALAVLLVGIMVDVFAQTTIVLGPNGELVGQIITLPPPPTWR